MFSVKLRVLNYFDIGTDLLTNGEGIQTTYMSRGSHRSNFLAVAKKNFARSGWLVKAAQHPKGMAFTNRTHRAILKQDGENKDETKEGNSMHDLTNEHLKILKMLKEREEGSRKRVPTTPAPPAMADLIKFGLVVIRPKKAANKDVNVIAAHCLTPIGYKVLEESL